MADAQLKLSRRTLLGAVCALPVLSEVGHDESGTVINGDRAIARYRRAEAALAAAQRTGDDRLYDRLLGRFNQAMKGLLTAPAPHPRALADKLDLVVEHEVWELTFAESCLAALKCDARRLAERT